MRSMSAGCQIYTKKNSDLATECFKFDEITVSGLMKPAKLEKIQSVLKANGFVLTETVWQRSAGFESNPEVQDVRLVYTKQI